MLEGPHLLAEALATGVVLEDVLITPEHLEGSDGKALLPRLPHAPSVVSPEVLASVTDADSPRGVVAVAVLPREDVDALPHRTGAVYLFLDGLQDPGNLGALARVAEAVGVDGMALAPGTVHPNHPRALRASAGSLLRLPTAREVPADDLARHLAPVDPSWMALVPRGGRDLFDSSLDLAPGRALVLALGAEGPGLSDAVADRAGLCLTIPLQPPVESLNVTVAAAVTLFELRRRCILAPSTSGSSSRREAP